MKKAKSRSFSVSHYQSIHDWPLPFLKPSPRRQLSLKGESVLAAK